MTRRAPHSRDGVLEEGLAAWYHRVVKHAAFEQLDKAFPELAPVANAEGWSATAEAAARRSLGATAAAVSCRTPGVFLADGRRVDWLDYLNGGTPARGAAFVRCVRELARRTGSVEPEAKFRPPALRESVSAVREAWFEHALSLARSPQSGHALRSYLERRGIPPEPLIAAALVGVAPGHMSAHNRLRHKGFGDALIEEAGVLRDGRWPGRAVSAWRDEQGRIGTLFCDATDGRRPQRLWLAGAARPAVPFLATHARWNHAENIVLVEDPIDALAATASGESRVLASGSNPPPGLFAGLARIGANRVTLLAPGETLLEAALDALPLGLDIRVAESPPGSGPDLTTLLARGATVLVERCLARNEPLAERLLLDRLALPRSASPAERARALVRCAPILRALGTDESAAAIAQRVSEVCAVDADCLERIVERSARGPFTSEDALCETHLSDSRALLAGALAALTPYVTADAQAREVASTIRAQLAPGGAR